jgi:cell division septation protein DedD/WD40 repeat protein
MACNNFPNRVNHNSKNTTTSAVPLFHYFTLLADRRSASSSNMKIRISKIADVLLISVALLLFSLTSAFADDIITFKYFFSDRFYYGENPLGNGEDPQFIRTKEAIEAACKVWEKATNGNIVFTLANNQEDADIIFEGWSIKGPKVSLQDGTICINGYGNLHLFSDYFPESHGITIFEDCNTICNYPGILDAANADSNHRARIFFNLKNSQGTPAPWYYKTDADKVSYVEAKTDVIRLTAHEIGHALGFCGRPDENSEGCDKVPECKKHNASIMCKDQVLCYQEGEDGEIMLGGMDDIDRLGVRDLTAFDKGRLGEKFFPATKILYGKVKDADGGPIIDAVVTTGNEKLTAKTDRNGIYSLWRVQPGTYTEKGHNPETDQSLGEIITITENAPNIIVKDFKFIRDRLNIQANSRAISPSGSFDDAYSFEATFSELDNDQQSSVSLFVDGSEVHQFLMPAADPNPVYTFSFFSLKDVKPGSHHYAFKASNEEGKWLQTLSGSFLVNRPSNIQLVTKADPKTVSVGKDNKTTITAWLRDDRGTSLGGETILFRTNFPGFFNPANGQAVTDSEGQAKIAFTPVSSGKVIIAAIPPYGAAASTTVSSNSPAVRLSFKIYPLGNNSYKATSYIKHLTDERPATGEAVKWSLQSSDNIVWTKQPAQKLDNKGKVSGTFSLETSEPTPVSITTTHIPTGVSGTGTFRLGGFQGYQIMPWKDLGKPIERSEWSSRGYFAVRQRKGAGVSIHRVSDWKKVWGGKNLKGDYHTFFFSPDGKKLAMSISGAENKIAILNVAKGNIEKSWNTAGERMEEITEKSFGWQEDDIYAIHSDNAIRRWSSSGKLKTTFSHNAEIQELRFNPVDTSQFASVDRYGELRIWNTGDPSSVKTIKVESLPTGKLKCLAWSHDGTTLSVGSGIADSGIIYTFDTNNWSKSGFDLPGLGNVNSLDYNHDASQLAIGHDEGMIVLNTNTYSIEYYNTSPSNHVRWSPDGSKLAAGGQIYVFDDLGFDSPKIEISTPQNGSSFTTKSIRIAGKIYGSQKISTATVKVNQEKPGALGLSPDGSFDQSVLITNEKNTIYIEAEDVLKNQSSVTMTVEYIADSIPPTLTEPFVNAGADQKETTFNLSIRIHDGDSGVDTSRITATIRSPEGNSIDKVPLYDDGNHGDLDSGDGIFGNSWHSSGAVEGLHSIDFYAFDKTGNSGNLANTGNFFVYDKPKIKQPRTSVPKPLSKDPVTISADITDASGIQSADLIYSTDSGVTWSWEPMSGTGDTFKGTIPAQSMGTVFYKVKAIDVRGYSEETGAYAYRVHDDTKPMVIIQEPATVKEAVTNQSSIVISGEAVDLGESGLKRVACSTGDINTGTLENWSFNVHLNQGINTITIVAEAQNGMLSSDTIDIIYSSKLAAPVFSPAAPFSFTDPIEIVIKSPDEGVSIHYTTDNTEPIETSPVAPSAIIVSETTSIKAKSYKKGWTPSATTTATYTLSEPEADTEQEKGDITKDTDILKEKSKSDKSLTIQVAAFKERKFADDMIEQLKKKGYPAYIFITKSQKNVSFYKVRIGSFKNKTEVEDMLDRLKKDKIKAIIVVNKKI